MCECERKRFIGRMLFFVYVSCFSMFFFVVLIATAQSPLLIVSVFSYQLLVISWNYFALLSLLQQNNRPKVNVCIIVYSLNIIRMRNVENAYSVGLKMIIIEEQQLNDIGYFRPIFLFLIGVYEMRTWFHKQFSFSTLCIENGPAWINSFWMRYFTETFTPNEMVSACNKENANYGSARFRSSSMDFLSTLCMIVYLQSSNGSTVHRTPDISTNEN